MPDSKQEVLQQIQQAWSSAQAQLAELRSAVERTGELAQLKLKSELLSRELDRAYRDLGEAVWKQVKAGRLELPAAVSSQLEAVEQGERRQHEQASSIEDLLAEGADVAEKMKKVLAGGGKKR